MPSSKWGVASAEYAQRQARPGVKSLISSGKVGSLAVNSQRKYPRTRPTMSCKRLSVSLSRIAATPGSTRRNHVVLVLRNERSGEPKNLEWTWPDRSG